MLFTCIKSWFFRNHLANFHQFHIDPSVEMWLIVYSNDHAPLTVRPIYSSSKLRTAQMMIFSLVAMIGLEKCYITSACLQWLCHSGERTVARGPLVFCFWNQSMKSCKHDCIFFCFRNQSMKSCNLTMTCFLSVSETSLWNHATWPWHIFYLFQKPVYLCYCTVHCY